MNKLVSTFLAGAAVLALSGGAFAAEEAARDTGKDANQTQGVPVDQAGTDRKNRETSRDSEAGRDSSVNNDGREAGRESPGEQTTGTDQTTGTEQTTGTVKEGGEDVTAEGRDPVKQEYEAALKECDHLSGSQKQTCTDAAKKKHGEM